MASNLDLNLNNKRVVEISIGKIRIKIRRYSILFYLFFLLQINHILLPFFSDGCTLEDKREFLAELDLMSRIGFHRNVISLIGACEHDGFMYLCTEFAPNGNLLCYLRQSRKLEYEAGCYTSISNNQLLLFASDIAEGMAYISDKQVRGNVWSNEVAICSIRITKIVLITNLEN